MAEKKILHLTLHRIWFDMIATGMKKEEYRTIKKYWKTRIEGQSYDEIFFRNGYRNYAPFMIVEYNGWYFGTFEGKNVYVLKLGKILKIANWEKPSEIPTVDGK
ncbi:MAG: ASCH domain-containing protein [Desulfobacteraceae bacterium]|nr:ASCH domain-containing protein [Desulfobacteraceae bacterium]